MFVEIILFSTFIFLLSLYGCRRSRNLPPGPVPFPIIGNLVQMVIKGKEPFIAFDNLSKEYGDLYSIRFGSQDILIMASYKVMRETMGKDEWSGRIWDDALQSRYLHQRLGMIFLEGDEWKEQRRFTLRHLRDFGFGKEREMEKVIYEELSELSSEIRQGMGDGKHTTIYMHNYFNLSVLNVLWTMMAGIRYSHTDQKLISLIQAADLLFKTQKVADLSQVFPILRKMFPNYFGETQQVEAYNKLHDFFREAIKDHRKSDSFGSSSHFIDVFLQQVDKNKNVESHKLFTEDQLICLCTDFFVAGSETTSNTLAFAILYMILHPEIQNKVYEEIISVVGAQGNVSLSHKSRLPFTEAVLMEIQRISVIAPLTPPHRLLEDVKYRGYNMPKGTTVLLNLYSINMDPEYWGDPQVFRPDRFLDNNGFVINDERFIPFGMGKRICPGESLAKMSLFLYFSTLVQHFKFETVAGHLDPSTEPVSGLTLSPKPFNVVVTNR